MQAVRILHIRVLLQGGGEGLGMTERFDMEIQIAFHRRVVGCKHVRREIQNLCEYADKRKDMELSDMLRRFDARIDRLMQYAFKACVKDSKEMKFEVNRAAFKEFAGKHKDDPAYHDKSAVFVNGELQGTGDSNAELVEAMYGKFGNVTMYVGNVTRKAVVMIGSPEICREDGA